jgi:hypothetical protein
MSQAAKEVQSHGFTWEKEILASRYGATAESLGKISYTSKYDLPATHNPADPTLNVSVKASGSKAKVDMGDALRIYDAVSSGERVHMWVVNYKQEGDTKKAQALTCVDLTGAKKELFGELSREDVAAVDSRVKAIPKGVAPDTATKEAYKSMSKASNARSGAVILNPKVDSKAQRRLQCSFNHFDSFITANPTRIVEQTDPTFLTAELKSGPRTFKKTA